MISTTARREWLHIRLHRAEREALEKYARVQGVPAGQLSTFYRGLILRYALKGKGKAEGAGKGGVRDKPSV